MLVIHMFYNIASGMALVGSEPSLRQISRKDEMPRRKRKSEMKPATVSQLVHIVTDLGEATKSLSDEDRKAYEDAQRSVVEARFRAETHQGHVRVL